MPFALLIIGAVLLISAARGTTSQGPNGGPGLFTLIESDFTGQNNFIFWAASILLVGAVGYIQKLKPLSVGFMTLIIIALFLRKGTGFFSQLTLALGTTQGVTPAPNSGSAASQGGSSLTSLLSSVEPQNPLTNPSSGIESQASLGGSSLTSLLSSVEPNNTSVQPSSSPVISENFGSSLLPTSSGTDLSFPALGIG